MPRMPRRRVNAAGKPRSRQAPRADFGREKRLGGVAVVLAAALGLGAAAWWAARWDRLADQAAASARGEDWRTAARLWRDYNSGPRAKRDSWLAEARAALAAGRAGQAEHALGQACALDPTDPEPWRLRLQVLRLEDRSAESIALGWAAYRAVPPGARGAVLGDFTLALLAEAPDDLARRTLSDWMAADPDDHEAHVAWLRRVAAAPRDGDPSRAERIAILSDLVNRHSQAIAAREALLLDLAEDGQIERGRALLDAWPSEQRDTRFDRLKGRWDLEFDHHPERAAAAFRRVLSTLPHDWSTRYRLARALHQLGLEAEARAAADQVVRLREALDPARLGPRLDADLARIGDPSGRGDLAALCEQVGLTELADAWRRVD